MKSKITAVIVLLCITAAFLLPAANAAGTVYFSAANNDIQPLNDETMPAYINGQYYLPYTFFSSEELGINSSAGDNLAIVYLSNIKWLKFDVARATVFNQDGDQYYQYSAKTYNGIIYIPVKLVCDFFGFTYSVIPTDPAPIIRVRTSSNNISDFQFQQIGFVKDRLKLLYDTYTGNPTPAASPTSSADTTPSYQNIIVYLSFFDLSAGKLSGILDTLSTTFYRCCFFVTEDEIADNAALLRRAAATGHMIGIWLNDGTYAEYQRASALLFEATKFKTVIISAGGDINEAAEEMAGVNGLIFWQATRNYDAAAKFSLSSLTKSLSTVSGRESLAFACTDKTSTVLYSFMSYLTEYKYTVRRISETSIPLLSAK